MKGAVFISLQKLVEPLIGIAGWQQLLDSCHLASEGAYTSGGKYEDAEMVALVSALVTRLDMPVDELLRLFGRHLFKDLTPGHTRLLDDCGNPCRFMKAVDQRIHVEIEKLHPGSSLPFMTVTDLSEHAVRLDYRSPRKLCFLAEGLAAGVADYYDTHFSLKHPVCMHQGADHCELELTFEPK
ncbi:heme NO-binding domain-containing protein [Simiduia agarivorans]|uniref:Heme NO binding domain-containing protein n=1 Tax=Simiduia agarivorans (strain DSM 21679 / JCM 13881 / BCRC 17597 / SA1) TaxID=1117647 RepID=K4KNI0_SIMAS|nr:heme NO-binding domain-containing protein [Simiduia agarivorans]AFU99785.1 heme NO binding domain-containing protein [Simiduia agarivorans SA1 = DSM 21679]